MNLLTSLVRSSTLGICLLGMGLLGIGCGRDALATCEEAQEQKCTSIKSCSDAVNLGGTLATNAKCDAQFDAYTECATDQEDVCTIDANCKSKVDAFATCVQPYCLDGHLDECTKVNAALGNPI